MIHHVVVAGAREAVDRLRPILMPSLQRTRWFEGAPLERAGTSGTWAAAALALPDPMCAMRMAGDGDDLVVVNGPALATGGDQTRLADAALDALRAGGTPAVAHKLSGGFNFVGITPSTGLRAFVDFSGTSPLYWHQGTDVAVFSNRTSTIAALTGSTGWDLQAFAWLLGSGTLYGEDMPRLGVSHLAPGREASVAWAGSRVELQRSPVWVWPAPAEEPGRDNLSPAEWDDVTAELVGNFEALKAFGHPVRLALSGGKDSRLCLALSKAAGLDGVVEARTNGTEDSAEVQCAAAAAGAIEFPHERIGPPPGRVETAASQQELSEEWWRRLHQHVYRFDAIVSPWDGTTDLIRSVSMNVRGIGGELYRRGNIKRVRKSESATTEELARLYATDADPLRVLRRDRVAAQDAWRTAWLETNAAEVHFDALPEKWYVDFRLSHWNGPLAQSDAGHVNVVPLLAASAARKNMELRPSARKDDRLHFEVIRRAAPELLAVPFVNDVWAPSIVATSPVDLPAEPFPATTVATPQALARRKWDFLEAEAGRIDRIYVDAARQTDMKRICEVRRLRRKLRRAASLKPLGAKELFSALGIALALLGRSEPAVDPVPAVEAR